VLAKRIIETLLTSDPALSANPAAAADPAKRAAMDDLVTLLRGALETAVDKRGVNRLLPELKAAGATDILELPISKIIP
jgi:ATP phosphoribosyltransferase